MFAHSFFQNLTLKIQSNLAKFVQINWCGDGVPESKKGLFHIHSSAVARFLQGAHVVISARNESDVAPALIMNRVKAAGGVNYTGQSSQSTSSSKYNPPIAPVGSSYTPIGKPDIAALRRGGSASTTSALTSSVTPKPAPPIASRPVFGAPKPVVSISGAGVSAGAPKSAGALYGRTKAPDDAWPDEEPVAPAAAAAAPPPPPALPSAPRPVYNTVSRIFNGAEIDADVRNCALFSDTVDL